jgi:hypothetical protein
MRLRKSWHNQSLKAARPLWVVGRSSGRVGLFCVENCTISQTALPLSGPESPTLPEGIRLFITHTVFTYSLCGLPSRVAAASAIVSLAVTASRLCVHLELGSAGSRPRLCAATASRLFGLCEMSAAGFPNLAKKWLFSRASWLILRCVETNAQRESMVPRGTLINRCLVLKYALLKIDSSCLLRSLPLV